MMKKQIEFNPKAIKIVMMMSLCYLILPQIIFELLALKTIFGIIFTVGSISALFWSWHIIPEFKESVKIPVYVFVGSIMLICIVFLFSGMGGFMGEQRSDYIRSNAILSDLVNYSWPVTYKTDINISTMNYYIAYYVPGAIVGKMFDHSFRAAETVTFIWSVLGMLLGILLIFFKTNFCKLKTVCFFLCWGGLDWLGFTIVNGSLFHGTMHLEHWASIERDYGNGHIANYMSTACNINWNPQHMIPAIILVGFILIMIKHNSYKLSILLSVSMLFWSPLVAIGIIPFGVVLFIFEKGKINKFISVSDILSVVFIGIPAIMYYLSMNLSSVGGRESIIRTPGWLLQNWTIVLLFIILEFGLVGYIIYHAIEKEVIIDRILCVTAIAFMVFCLLIDYGLCHDFSMRATVIPWYVLFTFVPEVFNSDNSLYKKRLAWYIIGASITCATEYAVMAEGVLNNGFTAQRALLPENTINGWGMQFQYVGSPSSFFFNKMCKNDTENYINQIISDSLNYRIYQSEDYTIYFYNNTFYVYCADPNKDYYLETVESYEGTDISYEYTHDGSYSFGFLANKHGLISFNVNNPQLDEIVFNLHCEKGNTTFYWNKKDLYSAISKYFDNSVITADITDAHWTHGISNADGSYLLFNNTLSNNHNLINIDADELIINNKKYNITDIDYDNDWIRVSFDKAIDSYDCPVTIYVEPVDTNEEK